MKTSIKITKMKKKILLGAVASLFAVATVFNMGLLTFNKQSDAATLEAISVMVQASEESNPGSSCDDCQYYMKDVTCIRFGYKSNGEQYIIFVGSRLKCKTPGTGSCNTTNCSM